MEAKEEEMIENLKNINDRNIKLSKFTEDDLNQLYLRVFNSADGELVMQDLANRCYVSEPTFLAREGEAHCEGMRAMYLSIQSRLQNAVSPEKNVENVTEDN